MNNYAIEMLNIRKEFPGIVANDNVTIQLKHGEIHALLGENGAGKSTLMSVLFGLYTPESGRILKDGIEIKITSPRDASTMGIGMVHQHFKLIGNFTVLQNIVLGDEETKGGFLQMKEARTKVMALSAKYGLAIEPDAKIDDITVGMQQRVEILKMLYRDNDILIFDEPTAMLTPQEIDDLLVIMQNLRDEGKSILFITHKLNEIKKIADRVSILRKGIFVGTYEVSETPTALMAELMVGHKVDLAKTLTVHPFGKPILEVNGLTVTDKKTKKHLVDNVSFSIRAGEIVGIAGIDGNGQQELAYAITGLGPISAGEIVLNGENITRRSINYRNNIGITFIPEDRQRDGLILDFNVADNLVLKKHRTAAYSKYGFRKKSAIKKHGDNLVEAFDIRSSLGSNTLVRSMSGGNQQKVIIAREVSLNPHLLLAMSPTRGLDIGAIDYIHNTIINERDAGKGVLLISLDLDEVMSLSDRLLVLHAGSIVAELDPKVTNNREVGFYMAGGKGDGK